MSDVVEISMKATMTTGETLIVMQDPDYPEAYTRIILNPADGDETEPRIIVLDNDDASILFRMLDRLLTTTPIKY